MWAPLTSMYKILIFGPQGAGKGTQAARLAKTLNLPALSMGDLLRREQQKGSEIGRQIVEIMTHGGLVSDAIALDVLKARLEEPDATNGYIIDGYPRNMEQYNAYIAFDQPTHVIVIDLPDAEALQRLAGRRTCVRCGRVYHLEFAPPKVPEICDACGGSLVQRKDDEPAAIQKRLDIYHHDTEPMAKEFEKRGLLHRVDGRGTMDDVEARVKQAIGI